MRSRAGKRGPVGSCERDRECGGERDDPAHAGEGKHERPLPWRRWIPAPQRGGEPARDIDGGKHPHEPGNDHDGADDGGGSDELGHRIVFDAGHQRARLQAGGEEHQALDQVDEEAPEENSLQPGGGADQAKAVPADVEPGSDGCEHAGAAEMLGRPIGEKRRQHRERDLDRRIVHPAPQAQHQPADADTPEDFADDDGDERSRGLTEREHAGAHRGDREPIEDERGGVVGQSLPFEHDQDAPGKLHPAQDRQRRHGVRRRDDRAQHETHRPRQAEEPMGCRRNRHGGEHDASHRQERDRTQIEAELVPAHRHRGRIDDRRQHQEQHQLGRELDRRQPGDERQDHPGDDQQNGRRDFEAGGHHRNRRNHGQQQDQDLDSLNHGRTGARSWRGTSRSPGHPAADRAQPKRVRRPFTRVRPASPAGRA